MDFMLYCLSVFYSKKTTFIVTNKGRTYSNFLQLYKNNKSTLPIIPFQATKYSYDLSSTLFLLFSHSKFKCDKIFS